MGETNNEWVKSNNLDFCFYIIGGVIIFTTGHIVLEFFIEPIRELDKVRGKICDTLIFSKTFI